MQSCKSCPSFLTADEALTVFGRHVGAPMCARYGHVLGRPGLSESGHDKVAEVFALKCDSYGHSRPDKPIDFRTRVVNPDPSVIARTGDVTFTPDTLFTCRGCENLVGAVTVQAEIGYTVDLCKAKGKLITRPNSECRSCPMAIAGSPGTSTDGLEIRAEYREGFVVPVELSVKSVTSKGNTTEEPSTYPTDAPVSEDDREAGIRAWRRVADSHGSGHVVFAPIYCPDLMNLSNEERALIPKTGDENHPELFVDYAGLLYTFVVEAFVLEETLALQGLPGVGKTEFARWVAWLMQLPFRRFSFSSESDVEDMLGAPQYSPERGTYFELGRIPIAYSMPGVIVYDELNLAPPAIREALRPTFDNSKQLVLDSAKPAIHVSRSKATFPVVAQNPSWDIRNVGTNEAAAADYDRLSIVEVELPPEAVERHIIIERCKLDDYAIPEKTLDLIMAVTADIREMSDQGTIPFTWGIRQTIKVGRKTKWYNLSDAFKRAVLDFYEPGVREMVLQSVSDRLG